MIDVEALYRYGFTDLISVVPPGAQLAPSSKIVASQVGKVPGRRLPSGLWVGYNWRKHPTTAADVRQWVLDGANIGLRADNYPAVDIDSTDENLSRLIYDFVRAKLGDAPLRIGRAPKKLMVYNTTEPFGRMRLWIERGEEAHLVEVLGQGQQYVIAGTHPTTQRPYEWPVELKEPAQLHLLTREKASAMLDELQEMLDLLGGWRLEREGDGKPITRSEIVPQDGLLAPSIEKLREVVEYIPNTNELFPGRDDYLKVGYAIRAAAGANDTDGLDIFSAWAAKWEGNTREPGNNPETVRADWRRFRPPFAVGFSYLVEQARAFGYSDAEDDFDLLTDAPASYQPDTRPERAVLYSDQWLAEHVVEMRSGEIR